MGRMVLHLRRFWESFKWADLFEGKLQREEAKEMKNEEANKEIAQQIIDDTIHNFGVPLSALRSLVKEALDAKDLSTKELLEWAKQAADALRCYALNYSCPGLEVGLGAGETSGCNGSGGDCPTCNTLTSLPSALRES